MKEVAIIIPAYEPDERLLTLLKELDAENMGPIYIVDDGSGAKYQEIFTKAAALIKRLGGQVLTHSVNKGKGRALKTAFQYILENNKKICAVVTADSDGQHTPTCIKKISNKIQTEKASLILGVRRFDVEGIPWKSRFGNNLTEKLFTYISGVHVSDTQTGLRGIPRNYMEKLLHLKGEGFEFEMRMLLDAAEHYNIIEIPIETIYDSADNHQTHFNPLKDSLKIYRILGKKFIRYIFSSCSSSIIDLLVFSIVCMLLKQTYPVIYITIATIIARVISATYNYFVNYRFVFKSHENFTGAALKYFLLAAIQMGCSAGFITLFMTLWPTGPELLLKIIIDSTLFFVSYSIQQKSVFKKF